MLREGYVKDTHHYNFWEPCRPFIVWVLEVDDKVDCGDDDEDSEYDGSNYQDDVCHCCEKEL